jgi:hypothetical protein
VEGNTTAGLGEEDNDRDEEGNVGNALDTLNPSPANGHVDETGVDGSTDRTEDGDPGEGSHGLATVLRLVHVVECTADENGTDATEQSKEETETDDGAHALGECETDEEDGEAEVSADVDDLAADHLTEGSEEEWRKSAGEVEGEETELTDERGRVQLLGHAVDTGAVGGCCQTDEEGHQVEESGDQHLVCGAPVEGVLLVAMSEEQDDVLLVILVDLLGQGKGNVDVVQLHQRSQVVIGSLVFHIFLQVFAADDAAILVCFLDLLITALRSAASNFRLCGGYGAVSGCLCSELALDVHTPHTGVS